MDKGDLHMPITYDGQARVFTLSGGDVSYVLHVDGFGHLMNLYWGARVPDGSVTPELRNYPGGASFDMQTNHLPWEIPTRGRGWYGTPAVAAVNAMGDDVVDLTYVSHVLYPGKRPLAGLPATYVEEDGEAGTLEIALRDELTGLRVTAVYSIYETSGAITRSLRLENGGGAPLTIRGLMAASVPL